jgi:hypothetical protein
MARGSLLFPPDQVLADPADDLVFQIIADLDPTALLFKHLLDFALISLHDHPVLEARAFADIGIIHQHHRGIDGRD